MAEGDIFWSSRAGRFYQEGRRGAVSNDFGTRSLIHDGETGQYIDSRGRTVPNTIIDRQTFRSRDLTAYDPQGRPFISSTIKSRVISEAEAQRGTIGSNQDIMVRTVVTTPDGATHIFYYPGKVGQNVDPETIKSQAAKAARAALIDGKTSNGRSYSISTNDIRNSTKSSQFIKRTTTIR
jgi:hypothetical protein